MKANNIEIIKREKAIKTLSNDRVELIKADAYNIAKVGIKGFDDMSNDELMIDYESAIGIKVKIVD